MANRAYLSIWMKGFTEATMLEQFESLLGTVPYSAERPGLTALVIRPVDPGQPSLIERDLRGQVLDAADVMAMAREHVHADSAYELVANWDLWTYDLESARWVSRPQRLELICHGEDYDDGLWGQVGHFEADIGFEHLFTGHAGLLLNGSTDAASPEHPTEAEFLRMMARPEMLREYHQKTRDNIQRLMDWIRAIESAVPVERYQLWSEGEENFEARLDEILAVR